MIFSVDELVRDKGKAVLRVAEFLFLEFVQIDVLQHFLRWRNVGRRRNLIRGQVEEVNEGLQKTVLCETVQTLATYSATLFPAIQE